MHKLLFENVEEMAFFVATRLVLGLSHRWFYAVRHRFRRFTDLLFVNILTADYTNF